MSRNSATVVVRNFVDADVPQLLELMRSLAEFEGYADEFAVTEEVIRDRGLGKDPEFNALVAEHSSDPGELLGVAVYHFIPYTFDLRPDMVLKELFVAEHARSSGVGAELMTELAARGRAANSKRIKWLVLPDNVRAKRFYAELGASHDSLWETWTMCPDRN